MFLEIGLKIREISRKKVFTRKNFQDGKFENSPNLCKSIASKSELPMKPFLACLTVLRRINRSVSQNRQIYHKI